MKRAESATELWLMSCEEYMQVRRTVPWHLHITALSLVTIHANKGKASTWKLLVGNDSESILASFKLCWCFWLMFEWMHVVYGREKNRRERWYNPNEKYRTPTRKWNNSPFIFMSQILWALTYVIKDQGCFTAKTGIKAAFFLNGPAQFQSFSWVTLNISHWTCKSKFCSHNSKIHTVGASKKLRKCAG